jgi:hypothetical protein
MMASPSAQFFMRPDEFESFADKLRSQLGVTLVLHRLTPPALEPARNGITMSDGSKPDSVFVSLRDPSADQLAAAEDPNPTAWGWVQIDVPREEPGTLFLAQAGAKDEWYDEESDVVRRNPEGPRLFKRVLSLLRSELLHPTWARNTVYGGEEPYANVFHSPRAAEFFRSGGRLRQEGVDNIAFSTEPTSSPS